MYYNPYFEKTLNEINVNGPIPEKEPDRQIYFVKKFYKNICFYRCFICFSKKKVV